MPDKGTTPEAIVAALNARDFAGLAAQVDEDVAIAGIGDGMDNGRDAFRDRLARHFQAFDESYGDALVMRDATGDNVAVRLTARGQSASGGGYSVEKVLLLELEGGRITRFALLG
jgi:ketosteroid isomerase-like protein